MKLANRRFTIITIIVIAIVFVSIFIVINEPMSATLEQDVLHKFRLLSYNKYHILEENLTNIENNALSISSRSEINKALSEYENGDKSLEELIDFTAPQYEEVTTIFDRLRSAARFTMDGHLIHLVGEDKDIGRYIDWGSQDLVARYIPEKTIVVVQSPIKNKREEIIGFDIVISDFSSVIDQLEEGGTEAQLLGELRGNDLVVADGKVISYLEHKTLGNTLAISMDESKAFDSVKTLKNYIYTRYLLVMLVVFIVLQILGIRYINFFFKKQNGLKEKAEESERKLRLTLDVAGEGLWDWDFASGRVSHNKRWCEIMEIDEETDYHKIGEFLGSVHPEDEERLKEEIAKAMSGEKNLLIEYRFILNEDKVIWLRDRGTLIRDGEENPARMIGSMEDITEKKQAEKDLFLEKEVLKSTLLSVGDGVISTDMDGVITVLNPAGSQMTGWSSEDAIGQTLNQVLKLKDIETEVLMDNEDILITYQKSINGGHRQALLKSLSGHEYSIIYSVAPISLPNGKLTGFVVVFKDISEIIKRQKEIEFLSFHDELTGLYNRRYLEDAMHRLDTKRNLPFSIMVIDLNNLKLTNDVFGHEMGDRIICNTANLLKKTFRTDDIVARTGGDEFIILLPTIPKEQAEIIKHRIKEQSKEYKYGHISISTAIGYAVKTKAEEKIEDIVRRADQNMYDDKQKNSNKVGKLLVSDFLRENMSKLESEKEHNEIVSKLSAELYKELGKSNREVEEFRKAIEMHDIGKIAVSEKILNKKEALNEEELRIMKRHPKVSYEIMKILEPHGSYRKAILHHHERIDGKGYPDRLKGHEIPLESKIIAIADAYESMTSKRQYKKVMTKEEAVVELKKNSGTQFDPDLVEIFIEKVLPNFKR